MKELIDKCISFCEGKRGNFTINGVKNKDFPENLKLGTEIQQRINNLIKSGLTTRQVAERLGCTQPTVMKHLLYYNKGKEFYNEWQEFWDFILPVREEKLEVLSDVLTEKEIQLCKKKHIFTVGQFIDVYTHNTLKEAKILSIKVDTEKKSLIFDKIKEQAYSLIK